MCENVETPQQKLDRYWNEYIDETKHHMIRQGWTLEEVLPILMREHPKWDWRSNASWAKELGVSKEEVVTAIDALWQKGIVVQNANNEEHFGLKKRVERTYPPEKCVSYNQYKSKVIPCPPTCPSPQPPVINPSTFELIEKGVLAKPVVTFYEHNSMFDGMQECLREIQKLISKAEELNKEVLTTFS